MFVVAAVLFCFGEYVTAASISFPEEKHFTNVRQLTWGGENVDATFSHDGKYLIYQGAGKSPYGTFCDQIYKLDTDEPAEKRRAQRISSGIGLAHRPKFFPGDAEMLYSSTSLNVNYKEDLHTCPRKLCTTNKTLGDSQLHAICTAGDTWDLLPEFEIYKVNRFGNALLQLTRSEGYNADVDISPDGKKVVFTSMRTGDPEIWIMDSDGLNQKQLTREIGYEGGSTFSHDGKKIVFRASRPKTEQELSDYKKLLSYNLVSPKAMEIYMMNIDGSNLTQVTDLGGANLSPHFMKGDQHIIFGSNFESVGRCGSFGIYIIDVNGKTWQRVTANRGGFDAFPTFDAEQKRFMWSSSRNGTAEGEVNIFVADWIDDAAYPQRELQSQPRTK